MKRLLLALLLPFVVSVASAQRLPHLAEPESYQLTFAPDFSTNRFSGDETIQIRTLEPTSKIVLNAVQIDFQKVTVTSNGSSQPARVTFDEPNQMATFTVDQPLPAGPASIHILYTGILNDQLRGFYIGKDDHGRKYAATQLEDTDARRAFPSFDEPAYKATFDVTVIADKNFTVISNGKVLSDSPGPGDTKHTVHFSTSPKMSSYLVAVVVGQFEYIEGSADGIPIRVYTSPGKKQLGQFALAAAENNLRFYNHYFSIPYPYGKLDLVGLADFSAGAMENTGCITFREILLLLDERNTSLSLKKTVASVIAHEMAHQWFGDLVTMKWWDDKWLNEGFATWMSSKPVAAWKPEWDMALYDLSDTINSLDLDSLVHTHPIHQPADTPAQILELDDAITYGKTAAVLRMLEYHVGSDAFRDGVNLYLKQHAYGNATASDFWNAQTQASHKPVDKIMPSWIDQAGVPAVTVKPHCDGEAEKITLTQQRYFYDRAKFDQGNSELWWIPVCLKSDSRGSCDLFHQKEETLTLAPCTPWLYANADARGFYRSFYDSDSVHTIGQNAERFLSPAERLLFLSDVWAGVRVGHAPIGDYLGLAQGLQQEHNTAVLGELLNELTFIGEFLVDAADRSSYQQWVRQLATRIANDVGWEPKPGEPVDTPTLRAQLLWVLAYIGQDPDALARAQSIANQVLTNPSTTDHELAATALRVAAIHGDASLYDKILADVKSASTPELYFLYQNALCHFTNPQLVERTLQYGLSPEVRSQDAPYIFRRLLQFPPTAQQAWQFVQAHWDKIENLGGAFAGWSIVSATNNFCDASTRDQVNSFFTAHPAPAGARSLQQSLERMDYCIDLKSQQQSQLATWLQTHRPAASH